MPDGNKYTTFRSKSNVPVAGMMKMPEESKGMPSTWGVYFTVKNMDEATIQITEKGGSVIMPPFEVPSVGKMAVFQDPTGAYFCTAEWKFEEMSADC